MKSFDNFRVISYKIYFIYLQETGDKQTQSPIPNEILDLTIGQWAGAGSSLLPSALQTYNLQEVELSISDFRTKTLVLKLCGQGRTDTGLSRQLCIAIPSGNDVHLDIGTPEISSVICLEIFNEAICLKQFHCIITTQQRYNILMSQMRSSFYRLEQITVFFTSELHLSFL